MSTKPLKKGNLPISKVIPSTALFGAQTGQRTLRVYKPRPEHPLEECLGPVPRTKPRPQSISDRPGIPAQERRLRVGNALA